MARIYDALLGGKNNFAADRDAARRLEQAIPGAAAAANDNRAFLGRAITFLAGIAGIDQFIDIGAGLPTLGHVHEISRACNPDIRVVYADNDPVVVAHGRALLADSGHVAAIEGDLRYPGQLMTSPEVLDLIDFSRPVAVLLVAVLHFVADDERPWSAVREITNFLAPGSYVVISHVTGDKIPDHAVRQAGEIYSGALVRGAARSHAEISRFFNGLKIIDPGLTDVAEWRPGQLSPALGGPALFWAGIGHKLAATGHAAGSGRD